MTALPQDLRRALERAVRKARAAAPPFLSSPFFRGEVGRGVPHGRMTPA